MKKTHMLLLAGAAVVGLAGCAGSPDSRELSQKTIEYDCGPGGEQALTVQYTFQGEEAVSARVMHMNQVVEMTRASTGHADMVGNTFRGGGYTWVTGKFDVDDVDEVDGDMLTRDAMPAPAQGAAYGGVQGGTAAGMQGGMQGTAPGAMPGTVPGGMHAGTGQAGAVGSVVLRDCRVS